MSSTLSKQASCKYSKSFIVEIPSDSESLEMDMVNKYINKFGLVH